MDSLAHHGPRGKLPDVSECRGPQEDLRRGWIVVRHGRVAGHPLGEGVGVMFVRGRLHGAARESRFRPPAPARSVEPDAQPDELGGGRCGCHGTAATAAGRDGVVPLEGDLGRAASQAGHPERRCLSPRPWRANVRGWRRPLWGGWSSQASTRPRRCGESDGQARGRAAERVVDGLRLARAATTCRRRAWDRQRVSPAVPPAGAEVVPAGTADRGDALGGVSAVTVPDCGGSP